MPSSSATAWVSTCCTQRFFLVAPHLLGDLAAEFIDRRTGCLIRETVLTSAVRQQSRSGRVSQNALAGRSQTEPVPMEDEHVGEDRPYAAIK